MENRKDFLRLVVDRDFNNSPIRGVYLITDEGTRLAERVKAASTAVSASFNIGKKQVSLAKNCPSACS